jgi:hypothetical protein
VAFIKSYSVWILVLLGLGFAAVLLWFFLSARGKGTGATFMEALGGEPERMTTPGRYSSTRITAAAVNERLGHKVTETEVETDREYALVVDEEALKMPPLPEEIDERTGKRYADDSEIRALMGQRDYGQAYEEYLKRVEDDGEIEFQGDLERTLSEYFLRKRELEKAARILEHHVATHATEDVDPETYFNLGYIHALTHTLNKSRRFLRLYVRSEGKPERVARARAILKRLENLN